MRLTAAEELLDRYDGFLIDAYGVLVDAHGALPGAVAFTDELARRNQAWRVVTNDASRSPASIAHRLKDLCFHVDEGQIVTSGQLVSPYFSKHGLSGARCLVLGTKDSREYVREAGGRLVELDALQGPTREEAAEFDVLVVCDDAGFPFLETVEFVMSALFRQIDKGHVPVLILPNPDLIYPTLEGGFGFTAGAIALLLEHALDRRFSGETFQFARLGKPNRSIYELACTHLERSSVVMIGDQLQTDIAGAIAAGLDSALVTSGVTRWTDPGGVTGAGSTASTATGSMPTYLLESLRLKPNGVLQAT